MNGHGRGYGNARMLHRITVLGDGGVGKTALTVQFTMSSFVESYDPTIEDCYRKQWVVDDQPCMLEVLDTAGQEEYNALRNQWIKDGEGFLLVYSIESENSFNRIRDIFERVVETKRSLGEPRPPIILVGNKSDTSMREVLPEQGQQLARSLGVDSFFEVSAKRNLNVESAFKQLVQFMAGQKNGTWPPLPGQGGGGSNRGSLGAGSTSNASGAGSGLAGGGGNAGRMGGGDAPRTKKKKRKNGCIIL